MPELLQLSAEEIDQLDAYLSVFPKVQYDIGRYKRDANYREGIDVETRWIRHLKSTLKYNQNLRERNKQPDLASHQATEGASKRQDELSPAEIAARNFLLKLRRKGKRATGKQIVAELKRKHFHLSESAFRRHMLPRLVRICGVRNDRDKHGYYIP